MTRPLLPAPNKHGGLRLPPTTTRYGRVVYNRRKHVFTLRDVRRIATRLNPPDDPDAVYQFVLDFEATILQLLAFLLQTIWQRLGLRGPALVLGLARDVVSQLYAWLRDNQMLAEFIAFLISLIPVTQKSE